MVAFPRVSLLVGLASVVMAASGTSCLDMFKVSPTSPSSETSSYDGSWGSVAASTIQETCTNFQWTITDVTIDSVAGTWSARCYGDVDITGTATGTLNGTALNWSATGTGTVPEVGSCPVVLTGTATLSNNQIRIPYTGTTCLGPVSGTELLRKPQAP